ncbi:SIR2 family protein [Variovorax sp. RCC_210]|uniref:SIR2 family protein n=1 Tax=Variovorax sp. RCC_210 TaxID=3239217 RepID=UPI003523B4DD
MRQLRDIHRRGKLLLFVGAGVSMGLGLPPWRTLIEHMAKELDVEATTFADKGSYLIRIKHGSIGPLRSGTDREWHPRDLDLGRSRIHELIAKGRFPLIYTTNYDRWLESAFEHYEVAYTKIVSVADLAKLRPDATQIIKFHGDLEEDASIVLDESSYFRRFDFESPLDIKLRADVLERTVMFIGYSLADVNIRYLFYKLFRLWKSSMSNGAQPVSYLFSPSASRSAAGGAGPVGHRNGPPGRRPIPGADPVPGDGARRRIAACSACAPAVQSMPSCRATERPPRLKTERRKSCSS